MLSLESSHRLKEGHVGGQDTGRYAVGLIALGHFGGVYEVVHATSGAQEVIKIVPVHQG